MGRGYVKARDRQRVFNSYMGVSDSDFRRYRPERKNGRRVNYKWYDT